LANLNRNIQNFPQIKRGLGHVTPKIFGIRLNISSKLLEVETSIGIQLRLEKAERALK